MKNTKKNNTKNSGEAEFIQFIKDPDASKGFSENQKIADLQKRFRARHQEETCKLL